MSGWFDGRITIKTNKNIFCYGCSFSFLLLLQWCCGQRLHPVHKSDDSGQLRASWIFLGRERYDLAMGVALVSFFHYGGAVGKDCSPCTTWQTVSSLLHWQIFLGRERHGLVIALVSFFHYGGAVGKDCKSCTNWQTVSSLLHWQMSHRGYFWAEKDMVLL